jgi:hypothetical protein
LTPLVRLARLIFPVAAALTVAAEPPSSKPHPPSPDPTPSATPAPQPARPISESIERVVLRVEAARKDPCKPARDEGKPCFPVVVEIKGPVYSVADEFRRSMPDLARDKSPVPDRPPTVEELRPFMDTSPGPPRSTLGGVTFDAVCTTKSVLKALRGRNDTYYVYRVFGHRGERIVLRDSAFDPATIAANPELGYELVGKFTGECEAIAAYRRAERELEERARVVPEDAPPAKLTASPTPPP